MPIKINNRIENRLPVAREGLPFILIAFVLTLVCILYTPIWLGLFLGAICFFIIYFFRDPNRHANLHPGSLAAPADGKILGIYHQPDSNNLLGEASIKISIFMSVFNVHVNRIPINGRVQTIFKVKPVVDQLFKIPLKFIMIDLIIMFIGNGYFLLINGFKSIL